MHTIVELVYSGHKVSLSLINCNQPFYFFLFTVATIGLNDTDISATESSESVAICVAVLNGTLGRNVTISVMTVDETGKMWNHATC